MTETEVASRVIGEALPEWSEGDRKVIVDRILAGFERAEIVLRFRGLGHETAEEKEAVIRAKML